MPIIAIVIRALVPNASPFATLRNVSHPQPWLSFHLTYRKHHRGQANSQCSTNRLGYDGNSHRLAGEPMPIYLGA